jgi:polysaccharide pyruvyl transferase WcaK-like protein
VVFAGGPLMDLPKQLVRHLYAVSLAARTHKPFFIEGVGCGPFVRPISQWVARRLVQMAKQISVRTSDDGIHPIMSGREVRIGRDPAFDYLESRGSVLTRMSELDRLWLDDLFHGVEGRSVVGINIRPIRHEYTTTAGRQGCAKYTRLVESRFEQSLAEAVQLYSRQAATEPRFIFFPVNAIQFGLSDLRSAYRIKRLVGEDVDFRIWEADASLDAIVALMRRLDAVIAMRFHAAIFALSQQRPVIGIDYRVGKRDKVAALLSDFDQSQYCARIDEVSAEWLCESLMDICQPPKVAEDAGRMAGLQRERK